MASVSDPSGLPPLIRLAESEGKLLVKLLNRSFNDQADSFTPVRNAELVIEKNLGRAPKGFRMSSPEGASIEIRAQASGSHFILPEFQIYACLEEI